MTGTTLGEEKKVDPGRIHQFDEAKRIQKKMSKELRTFWNWGEVFYAQSEGQMVIPHLVKGAVIDIPTFLKNLINNQKDLDPEIQKTVDDNLFEL
jgi:hypothetical protein